MIDIDELCEKYFWLIDSCKSNDEYRLSVKRQLSSFAAALTEKPKLRTKVVYEPVNQNGEGGAYWECARDFANCVEFASSQDNCNINDNRMLLAHYENRSLCRVVEKEIDWKDELSFFFGCLDYGVVERSEYHQGEIGLSMEINEIDFISMCHLVASLTDKPE